MRPALALLVLALAAAAHAAELTADQIVEKANLVAYYAGTDGRAEVTMTITDKGGKTRIREFVILRLNEQPGGDQKFYVYFEAPSDVRKMAYLVWKRTGKGRDDDRWMWLPDLNLKRRIAPGDKRTSFVGSDFFYEDVSGRNRHADRHELLAGDDKHHVIKNTPVDPDSVEFAHYTVWIDKQTFLPMRAEYVDRNGETYRIVEALEVKDIQGHPTVVKARAADLKSGGHTINTFTDVKYDIKLKKTLFTERFLRRPPREVRK